MSQRIANLIFPIALILMMYFLMIRPQRKREKEIQEMRQSLANGDEILTVGGIYGKIVKVKEDIVTIEVGSDKTRMDISKWAVGSIIKSKNNKQEKEKKDNNKK